MMSINKIQMLIKEKNKKGKQAEREYLHIYPASPRKISHEMNRD